MGSNTKGLLFSLIFGVAIFGGSYLWRQFRNNDIENNSTYTFGKIVKKVGSLNNGIDWEYRFRYKNQEYKSYRPTHIDYEVNVGYFLVHFSSKNPEHSKILYEHKLKVYRPELLNETWTQVPDSLTINSHK